MADIRNIEMGNESILVSLDISKDEYNVLKNETKDILLIPSDSKMFNEVLTTGTLGNSNRNSSICLRSPWRCSAEAPVRLRRPS